MFRIIEKTDLARQVTTMVVQAPQIAAKAMAGQFAVVIADEKGERIPLTLADWDREKGTITLIFQQTGYSTRKLASLKAGESISHILGPLGHPTQTKNTGTVICIGGGVGIAELYPVAKAFKGSGSHVIGIIGARSKDLLILEDKIRAVCDELSVATDDGSYGRKGLVTDLLRETAGRQPEKPQGLLVYAIGPVPMMKAVAEITRGYGIRTIVSLNPIMVDATGMCGACRVRVGGKTVFGCVEGPEFDAHQVDFDELQKRLDLFREQERQSDEKFAA